MRLKVTLIFLLVFSNHFVQAQKKQLRTDSKPIIFFNYITYSIGAKELYSFQVVKNIQTLHLYQKSKTQIVLAEDHVPQSFNSVKIRALEEKVPIQKIKIVKRKNFSIFYYEKNDFVTVYSTLGGKILIPQRIFDINKINFKNKTQKNIAKL